MEDIKMEEVKPKREKMTDHFESLANHVEGYFRTYYKLTVVKLTEKVANVFSAFVNVLAVAVFGILFLFFACIGIAIWLGNVVNSTAGGFLIMAGIFGIVIAALIFMRKKTLFPLFRNMVIKKIYDK